jgi:hypothetical protein
MMSVDGTTEMMSLDGTTEQTQILAVTACTKRSAALRQGLAYAPRLSLSCIAAGDTTFSCFDHNER